MMLYSFTADHYSRVSCARTATVQRWAAIKNRVHGILCVYKIDK